MAKLTPDQKALEDKRAARDALTTEIGNAKAMAVLEPSRARDEHIRNLEARKRAIVKEISDLQEKRAAEIRRKK